VSLLGNNAEGSLESDSVCICVLSTVNLSHAPVFENTVQGDITALLLHTHWLIFGYDTILFS
jgi:hypothetical protein